MLLSQGMKGDESPMAFAYFRNLIGRVNPYRLSDAVKSSPDLNTAQKATLLNMISSTISGVDTGSLWDRWYKRTHAVTS